jgi:hypothetical protein
MGKTSIYPLFNFNGNLYATSKDMKPQYGQLCYYPTIDNGILQIFDKGEMWDPELCNLVVASTDKAHFSLPFLHYPTHEPSFDENVIRVIKNAFVRGQNYELAYLMRDEEKRIVDNYPLPTHVELELCKIVNVTFEESERMEKEGLPFYVPIKNERNYANVIKWLYESKNN